MTYEYECKNPLCKKIVVEQRKMAERENPIDCPECFTRMKFIISATPGRVTGGTPRHYR